VGTGALKPRINFVTLGVLDLVAMRAFCERLGFVASSASNSEVACNPFMPIDVHGRVQLP
jgi:hypothetical protein